MNSDLQLLYNKIKSNNYDTFLLRIETIILTLCSFTPNRPDIHSKIKNIIDIDIIRNILFFTKFTTCDIQYIIDKIHQLCLNYASPYRDSQINSLFKDIKYHNNFNYDDQNSIANSLVFIIHNIENILCMIKTDINDYLQSKRFINDFEILTSEGGQEWLKNRNSSK